MKIKRIILALSFLIVFTTITASATESDAYGDYYDEQIASSGADELMDSLPEEAQKMMEDLGLDDLDYEDYINFDPKRLLSLFSDIIAGNIKNPLKSGAAAVGITIICAVLNGFKTIQSENTLSGVYNIVATLSIGAVIIVPIMGCISDVCAAINLSGGFMLAFIPVAAAIIAASGNPASAYAYNAVILAAAEAISRFSTTVLMPLVTIYMGINIASGVSPHIDLRGVSETIKKSVTTVLTFCATIFTGALSIQTLVTGAADTVTMKTAKFIAGNFIPFVGGAISDTLATVQGCIGLVKSTVGAFGIIALAVIYLPVLIEVLCWIVILNLCAICSDIMDVKSISSMLKSIGSALSILTAVLLFCGVLLIISTAIVVKLKA